MNGASGFIGTTDKPKNSVRLEQAALERPFFLPEFRCAPCVFRNQVISGFDEYGRIVPSSHR